MRFEVCTIGGQILAVIPFRETLSSDGELDPQVAAKWVLAPEIVKVTGQVQEERPYATLDDLLEERRGRPK